MHSGLVFGCLIMTYSWRLRTTSWLRTTIFCGLLLAFAFALLPTSACAEDPIPDVPGWDLVWHDEFDGASLNNTNWEALNRRDSFNNEKQYYHPNQVEVVNGNLELTAINVPRSGKAYQSGLVTSRSLYGPGRFEARIDLPTSQGMWPAFWLNSNHVPWPQGGEIDIMENRGSEPEVVSSAYHWQTNPGPCCDQHEFRFRNYSFDETNFHDGFHTYAVEWDETELRFFIDGRMFYRLPESPARPIFETEKNIILNLAVGGDFGGDPDGSTVWPQTMRVDYVRYWQRQTDLPGDYNDDGKVDAADYTIWRDTYGATGIGLPADGSGNGTVSESDYQTWLDNFSSTGASTAVPEPNLTGITAVGIACLTSQARRAK